MTWYLNSVELVFVIASIGGCCGAFVMGLCSSMRMSRCKTIKICCGCAECQRENLSEEEYKEELENQHHIQEQAQAQAHAKPQEAVV